ncbi:hypothetical protein [Amycolatopsis sp. NPDC051061]|uniref:hypothetical protein n=1 Tax=Amycolatopsis sp. NPDC051061 TaxID=3155042 RepID=UPI003425F704
MGTKFDAEAIKKSAENIGGLMDDMSAFEALKNHWPNAGGFKLAVWLERIVDDRRNAIVAHAEHLKLAFGKMEEKLTAIANDFQNADGDNADKIKSSMSELEGEVTQAVNSFDATTENAQHNYTQDTGQTGPNANNPHDGDGYNDNLNDEVTT